MDIHPLVVIVRPTAMSVLSLRVVFAPMLWIAATTASIAGTFDPQVGQPGSLAIPDTSSAFVGWAASVTSLDAGPRTRPIPAWASHPSVQRATRWAHPWATFRRVVSLGDGGSITLGFDSPITNGPGPDFAVFENGFLSGNSGLAFLELGLVAVSSDGVNFFTFPAVSETQTTTQIGTFGLIDASNLYDLAGKYTAAMEPALT